MRDHFDPAPHSSEPLEYVADLLPGMTTPNPATRTRTDPRSAAALVAAETRARLAAVLTRFDDPPAVLLSGGVDSIYVAAVATALGRRPHAITVVTDDESDTANAAAAAAALGLTHDILRLTRADVVDLAHQVMRRLGTSELWEVTAAIPLLAARRSLDRMDRVGAILTGSGADALFGGGRRLTHPIESADARADLDRIVRTESAANFRYDRLVPHFYPAVLEEYADRLILVFQTVRWWRIAETLAPPALFGEHEGSRVDKLALRIACANILPADAAHLAWAAKSPIQRSSGLVSTLAQAGRGFAAGLHGALTYGDPRTEDYETVTTRLFLSILNAARDPAALHDDEPGTRPRPPSELASRRSGRRHEIALQGGPDVGDDLTLGEGDHRRQA
ncbi:asparagine synthase-related protein [Nocardia blacklockiae]|uniref:asparagine synthase-related protein n=1 Tax=Nocardia blacklockiae TaxID=480036 RepID=UPI0018932EDC|nr:asparagine synthase-related protein [Nocardia blacklockiae]MBF6172401.1 hypothetical protein [Nocardia blacklockiae]